jgi:hypothetical protein
MTRIRTALLGAAAALAATVSASPAQALEIVYTDISGGNAANGTQARFGFNVAKLFWESVLKDDITVRINIGFDQLDPGVIAQAGSTSVGLTVQDTYALLGADVNGQLDAIAVANLRPLIPAAANPGNLSVAAVVNGFVDPASRVGYQHGTARLDADGSVNNIVLDVNTAVVKSLGVTSGVISGVDLATAADAEITFSNQLNFDFDPTDGISDESFDFIGVAIHEVGHSLGFVSGVDIYDLVSRNNGPLAAALEGGAFGPQRNLDDAFRVMSVLDLFRYGDRSDDFGAVRQLDWTTGGDKFFSIDGGLTEVFGESNFSTGSFNGDGNQASHWIDNEYLPREGRPCSRVLTSPIGIMNPTSGRCESGAVTALDLAAFDAMGWDLDFNVLGRPTYSFTTAQAFNDFGEQAAAIPEPATWAMMIAGFGFVGVASRRRSKAQVTYA